MGKYKKRRYSVEYSAYMAGGSSSYSNSSGLTLKIRDDSKGAEDMLDIDEQPEKLSYAHLYNLLNQGWTPDLIGKYYVNVGDYHVFPGNNLAQQYLKDSTTSAFKPEKIINMTFGNTPAAKGHFILDFFNQKRNYEASLATSMLSVVGAINDAYEAKGEATTVTLDDILDLDFPNPRDPAKQVPDVKPRRDYVADMVAYAGRIFYLCGDVLLYSQVISEDLNKSNMCYSDADPTSEQLSDIVETDGGFISLPEIGEGVKLATVGEYICVFGSRGAAYLTGTANNIFTATAYTAGTLSSSTTQAPDSFVDTEYGVFYWGNTGVSVLGLVDGNISTQDLSSDKIDTFYGKLTNIQHKWCKGIYSASKKKVYWFYPGDNNRPRRLNMCLIYDIRRAAFTVQEIATKVKDDVSGDMIEGNLPEVVSGCMLKVPYKAVKEYPIIAVNEQNPDDVQLDYCYAKTGTISYFKNMNLYKWSTVFWVDNTTTRDDSDLEIPLNNGTAYTFTDLKASKDLLLTFKISDVYDTTPNAGWEDVSFANNAVECNSAQILLWLNHNGGTTPLIGFARWPSYHPTESKRNKFVMWANSTGNYQNYRMFFEDKAFYKSNWAIVENAYVSQDHTPMSYLKEMDVQPDDIITVRISYPEANKFTVQYAVTENPTAATQWITVFENEDTYTGDDRYVKTAEDKSFFVRNGLSSPLPHPGNVHLINYTIVDHTTLATEWYPIYNRTITNPHEFYYHPDKKDASGKVIAYSDSALTTSIGTADSQATLYGNLWELSGEGTWLRDIIGTDHTTYEFHLNTLDTREDFTEYATEDVGEDLYHGQIIPVSSKTVFNNVDLTELSSRAGKVDRSMKDITVYDNLERPNYIKFVVDYTNKRVGKVPIIDDDGFRVLADNPVDSEQFTFESSILLCYDVSAGKVTFGDFRNNRMTDWAAADYMNGYGYEFDSYLISHPMNAASNSTWTGKRKADMVHNKTMPYMINYFKRTEKGFTTTGESVYPSQCQGSVLWDWRTNGDCGKWDSPQELYRYNTRTLMSDGYVITKTNVRGIGRAYQVKLQSVGDSQFIIEGVVFDMWTDGRL